MADKKPKKYKPLIPPWILGGLVLFLLTMLVMLQSSNMWKSFSIETANDTLLLYALSSLNFFAFVIFAFIFIRSLLKLSRERRALEVGSQIKSRLIRYFFAISILPIIAMAVFSYLFMNRALERWFAQIPESAIRESRLLQEQAIEDQTLKLRETTQMLATTLEKQDITNEKLTQILERGNLTRIEILSPKNEILAASEKKLSEEQKIELEKTLGFIRQNDLNAPDLSDGKGFDATVAVFPGGRMLVVVPDLRPETNVNQMIENSLKEFDRLKQQAVTVRLIGLMTLGLLTFLLIFASSWTALYIARGLTVPIKALAEGSKEIARGNFAHRVDVLAEDELALLVTAFNEMSARLESSSSELRERRKYIETVLQSLSTGVISFDAENRVTTINKAAIQMFRLEKGIFEGATLSELVSRENLLVLEKLLGRAKRIGQAAEQTILMREHTDGGNGIAESLPVALTATALPKTSEGNSAGVVLVIEDLTELLTAQRASAWQEVARRMAHEIKNPLTPIQLSAERIAKRFAQSEQPTANLKDNKLHATNGGQLTKIIGESTETILREVSSLKLMVDEFSRFARLPNVKLENGNVNDVIEKSTAHFEDRLRDIKLETALSQNLLNAMIDDEQLRRVFINLIENAIEAFDANQADKRILVKTSYDKKRDLIIAEVADNGNGIPPQDFQKLFQPYFSTKGRGTGLGLAIVQRIVIEHGGKIRAVSNIPKGAKFIIELPVTNA